MPRDPAADVWRHTLVRIPTTFGRLAYLASLRDQNTGLYQHHGLAQMYGEEESCATLRQSHERVFEEWLCFGLEQQKTEVAEYLGALDGPPHLVLDTWVRLSPYRNFVPTAATADERRLYLADLEAVLELLRHEHGVSCRDRES
jgi:hypothetical protein